MTATPKIPKHIPLLHCGTFTMIRPPAMTHQLGDNPTTRSATITLFQLNHVNWNPPEGHIPPMSPPHFHLVSNFLHRHRPNYRHPISLFIPHLQKKKNRQTTHREGGWETACFFTCGPSNNAREPRLPLK